MSNILSFYPSIGLLASQLQSMIIVNEHTNRIGEPWAISLEDLQHNTVAVPVEAPVIRYGVLFNAYMYLISIMKIF